MDAALDGKISKMGGGVVVIRNWEGDRLIALLCMPKLFVSYPVRAELNALWSVMILNSKTGLSHVIFIGDALCVIEDIQKVREANWPSWHGMSKSLRTLKQFLEKEHAGRFNNTAH